MKFFKILGSFFAFFFKTQNTVAKLQVLENVDSQKQNVVDPKEIELQNGVSSENLDFVSVQKINLSDNTSEINLNDPGSVVVSQQSVTDFKFDGKSFQGKLLELHQNSLELPSDIAKSLLDMAKNNCPNIINKLEKLINASKNNTEFITNAEKILEEIGTLIGAKILLEVSSGQDVNFFAVKSPGAEKLHTIKVDLYSKVVNLEPNHGWAKYSEVSQGQYKAFGPYSQVFDPPGDGNCMPSVLMKFLNMRGEEGKSEGIEKFKNFLEENKAKLTDKVLCTAIDKVLEQKYDLHANFSKVDDMHGILLIRAAILMQESIDHKAYTNNDMQSFVSLVKGGAQAGYMNAESLRLCAKILDVKIDMHLYDDSKEEIVVYQYESEDYSDTWDVILVGDHYMGVIKGQSHQGCSDSM